MALVPCESCRRHVRASDDACPFCKTVRIGTKVVAVAASAFVLAGCFSPGAKYGGPPAVHDAPDASPRLTAVDAGPVGRDTSPAEIYGTPPPAPPKPKP